MEQNQRSMYGKPIREETTRIFYPHKISLSEFVERIRNSIDPFHKNLSDLDGFKDNKYIEEWFETMGAWMEIEPEPK